MKEIVSSQLDVDRMDYMIRDQANTGAQIGGFDGPGSSGSGVGSDGRMYVKRWGLPAIEAYLVTRYHMYQQVYFHKVNMLTQAYLVNMLERAKELAMSGDLEVSKELAHMLLNESSPRRVRPTQRCSHQGGAPCVGQARRCKTLRLRRSPVSAEGLPQIASN